MEANRQFTPTHHLTCAIQWIDDNGKPTPDNREAIGTVYREAYITQYPSAVNGVIQFERSEDFLICAEHAKQLKNPGMEHWHFQPLKAGVR